MEIQDVPRPTAPPGGILVRVTHSVISIGTEKMKVEQAKMNLLQKARARPDQVRKVLETARNLGWRSAMEKVRNRLESPSPLGYSAAGVVVEVDPGTGRFKVGDRVACGGAECAFHAEYIAVPDMLAAPVPDPVPNWKAAYTTLCSISLHAVRQTQPNLGEKVLVMGQGLVGLLITNFLKISGARVMAVDVLPAKRAYAEALGAEKVVILGQQTLMDEVRLWTDGYGVDAAVICTASQSNTPIEQAAEACRDRGKLVDVGITKIELPWRLFADKELDFRFSRSYGPGRYDPNYEWGGNDYPIGYVRWTEQRNFQACLHSMATGELNLDAITTRRVKFEDALPVYQSLVGGSNDIGIVLEYPENQEQVERGSRRASGDSAFLEEKARQEPRPTGGAAFPSWPKLPTPVPFLDVIGAGNFARTMLLPHLKGQIPFRMVVNQTSLSANHVKTKFAFQSADTNADTALAEKNGGVVISTRHNIHAPLVLKGLANDRHIFVEKPLCITEAELHEIDTAVARSKGTVMVGFNRRFAPASVELKRALAAATGPKTAVYRVLPGKLDPKHWYANIAESGGRIIGEACHFLDYFCFLFGSRPIRVAAQNVWPVSGPVNAADSIAAQVEFEDGSCGQLVYTAEGDPTYPKETVSIFAAGLAADIVNYQELRIHQRRKATAHKYTSKGHAEEMQAWAAYLRGQTTHPLPYEQSRQSMLLTFATMRALQERGSVEVPS